METDLAEVSSIASSLQQLSRRVTDLADAATRSKNDDVASDLVAVERALTSAVRRLDKMLVAKSPSKRTFGPTAE